MPVSGGSPSERSARPNPLLEVDNKSGKIRTETYSSVFVRGLRIPSRFSPCKTHSREMAQTSDHSIQLFTDTSNEGWGAHLNQSSTQGLWSDGEKRLHINVVELKAVSLALRSFKDQCQNKQGGTHSAEMCALLWKIMTWCHCYHIT